MAPELEAVIAARSADLGEGMSVKRALPSFQVRSVGPFVFVDEMGPVHFGPGQGLDVRPHPHIGLATVTYLFDGEILHRDSLGNEVPIRPGAVNWMTAGRGIVHSERTPAVLRRDGSALWGLQVWVALPLGHEDGAPAFVHHNATGLPERDVSGHRVRVILGEVYGARSPVATLSPMFYADVAMQPGAPLPLPAEPAQRAAYVLQGRLRVGTDEERQGEGRLLVFREGVPAVLNAETPARLVLFGGPPLDAPRFVWWNFVSSSRDKIEAAKQRWSDQLFDRVPGETEFVPLPPPRPPAGAH